MLRIPLQQLTAFTNIFFMAFPSAFPASAKVETRYQEAAKRQLILKDLVKENTGDTPAPNGAAVDEGLPGVEVDGAAGAADRAVLERRKSEGGCHGALAAAPIIEWAGGVRATAMAEDQAVAVEDRILIAVPLRRLSLRGRWARGAMQRAALTADRATLVAAGRIPQMPWVGLDSSQVVLATAAWDDRCRRVAHGARGTRTQAWAAARVDLGDPGEPSRTRSPRVLDGGAAGRRWPLEGACSAFGGGVFCIAARPAGAGWQCWGRGRSRGRSARGLEAGVPGTAWVVGRRARGGDVWAELRCII